MHTTRAGGSGAAGRLELLNGFSLRYGEREVALSLSAQRVVAFLALRPGWVLRVHVAAVLWQESSDDKACGNLRTALWRIRQSAAPVVDASHTHLALSPALAVDVRRVTDLAHLLLERPAGALDADIEPLLAPAELLSDWYDDWVLAERERVRLLRLHALEAICPQLAEDGRFARAVQVGMAAVESDPLRESAHRALIGAHMAHGNQVEAVRAFRRFRSTIQRELGLMPSPRMQELVGPLRIS